MRVCNVLMYIHIVALIIPETCVFPNLKNKAFKVFFSLYF